MNITQQDILNLYHSPDPFPVNLKLAWHLSGWPTYQSAVNFTVEKLIQGHPGEYVVLEIEEESVYRLSMFAFSGVCLMSKTTQGKQMRRKMLEYKRSLNVP
jgi:hypothetical protein